MKKVSVIIPSYNGTELLKQFLPYLLSTNCHEIIVVDNGSIDNSITMLADWFQTVKVVREKSNIGTALASNHGAEIATGDYLFFTSNDIMIYGKTLEHLARELQFSKGIGIATCKILNLQYPNTIDSMGGSIDILGFPQARYIGKPYSNKLSYPCYTFFSFGGALMIRKELFWKIGGFDPALFTLGDDIDLCWRVRLQGYHIAIIPEVSVYHSPSSTLKFTPREKKRCMSETHNLRILIKNYSMPMLALILPFYFMLLSAEIVFYFCLGKFSMVRAIYKAIKNSLHMLPDTLKERKKVQSQRLVSDLPILINMSWIPNKLIIFADFIFCCGKGKQWDNYFK